MAESIISEVISILSDLFIVDPEELSPDSSPDTVEAWDSLQHLNLVIDVEQKYNISLSPAEIEAMVSVQAIVGIVNTKIKDV
jgi:acyl carrier protein